MLESLKLTQPRQSCHRSWRHTTPFPARTAAEWWIPLDSRQKIKFGWKHYSIHITNTFFYREKKRIYRHCILGTVVILIHHSHITHHRSSPPSSWSAQFWPSSCSLSACSSSRGSQPRWHPDGIPPPHTSWTTERCPLQGLSMPCSPGRRLDSYCGLSQHTLQACIICA